MIDRIAVLGLLAGMVALWIWDWQMLRILERHERRIQDLQAWRIITDRKLRPKEEPERMKPCGDPHALECGTCQRFVDERCETLYDCSCCYECYGVGGCWEPRKGRNHGGKE